MRPRRPIAGLAGMLAIGGVAAGCGTAQPSSTHRASALVQTSGTVAPQVSRTSGAGFGWLASGRGPAGWSPAGAVAGAALPRPPGWQRIRSDRGTLSFARLSAGGLIVGYLNVTPRSGEETLANWVRFRIHHNAAEGDRNVRPIASAGRLRIGAARASCVVDEYATVRSRYREIACLVAGRQASAVVVGAAPPSAWGVQAPVIERAIAGFVASWA